MVGKMQISVLNQHLDYQIECSTIENCHQYAIDSRHDAIIFLTAVDYETFTS